jgi:hypothetical protein
MRQINPTHLIIDTQLHISRILSFRPPQADVRNLSVKEGFPMLRLRRIAGMT